MDVSMQFQSSDRNVGTLVIGGGQSGLALGYFLRRRGLPFLIVDAHDQIGGAWRSRWDSLRLFTPNRFNSLPGMKISGPRWGFPTKDEFGDYLKRYAERFELPIRTGVKIDNLAWVNDRYVATAGDQNFEADNVVVAMSSWQTPRKPEFANALDLNVVQMHAAEYRNSGQLEPGPAAVVGTGNSGADIALELAKTHQVWLSGPENGQLPFRPESPIAHVLMPFVGRVIFHRVLSTSWPIGRKARPKVLAKPDPLIRVKKKDLAAAGVKRVPRVSGVDAKELVLEDGSSLPVANVIWCTGFDPGWSWIDLPVFGEREPLHDAGIVAAQPGLYFIGLRFLRSKSSEQIHGVGRDAERIAKHISKRSSESKKRSLSLTPVRAQ